MLRLAIPPLHLSSAAAAEEFYCQRLGFRKDADGNCLRFIREGNG